MIRLTILAVSSVLALSTVPVQAQPAGVPVVPHPVSAPAVPAATKHSAARSARDFRRVRDHFTGPIVRMSMGRIETQK